MTPPPFAGPAPCIGAAEIGEVVDTLRSGSLARGPKTGRFEQAVARFTGAEGAVATTSGTAALHLALLAAGVGAGDEVITTGLTCAATVNVVVQVGATPVLVDVTADTLTIDPDQITAAITPATKAIIPVHYAGHPADMDAIGAIAARHDLTVIEDAAHAIGATYRGRPIGSISPLTVFSFYANKNMTTGEGGMLTGHPELLRRALARRAELGYEMTDLAASLGIHQLARLPRLTARRHWIAERYSAGLRRHSAFITPSSRLDVRHAWHLYTLRLDPLRSVLTRDTMLRRLRALGIPVTLPFRDVSSEPWCRHLAASSAARGRRATARAVATSLSLPLSPALTDDDVERVLDAVGRVLANGRPDRWSA